MAVDLPQPDLPRGHEAEEQAHRGVFGRQRPLGLHPPAKLLVQALDGVRGPERLPLRLGEAEEREELVAPLGEASGNPGAAFGPLPLEGGVSGAGVVAAGGVHDAILLESE